MKQAITTTTGARARQLLAHSAGKMRNASARASVFALLAATNLAHAGGGGSGGPIGSIVNASNIIAATVTAICATVMTAAWGIAGYRMAFQGVAFRDVSSNVVGGAIAGAAGAIAAVFIST